MKKAAEAAAVWVAVADLRPWDQNPRLNEPAVAKVAESIKRFGFGAPILARLNGELIAGHTRLKAALKLGLDRVPVRYLDITADEAHQLAIADNKLGEIAEWDEDLLAEVLAGFDAAEAALTGFSAKEMKDVAFRAAIPSEENGGVTTIAEQWKIVVDCRDEQDQLALLDRFNSEGRKCHAIVS